MANDENRSAIAWVVEQGEFNYSPALAFASDIRVIVADRLTPNAEPDWHLRTIAQMRKAFVEYIPGLDYVIPTGKPVRMMLAAMVMRERGTVHKLLGWDDRTQRYFEYVLDLRKGDPVPGILGKRHRG